MRYITLASLSLVAIFASSTVFADALNPSICIANQMQGGLDAYALAVVSGSVGEDSPSSFIGELQVTNMFPVCITYPSLVKKANDNLDTYIHFSFSQPKHSQMGLATCDIDLSTLPATVTALTATVSPSADNQSLVCAVTVK